MLDIRDSAWQAIGVIIGVILGVITIILTIYIYREQKVVKSLSYQIIESTPLLTVNSEIKNKLKFLYENREVDDIHLLILEIKNDGNIPIESRDFEPQFPLTFSFGEQAKILSADIIETTPKDLDPKIERFEAEPHKIVISPLLLNHGDRFRIKLLLTQFHPTADIKLSTRISGVKEVKKSDKILNKPKISSLDITNISLNIIFIINIIGLILSVFKINPNIFINIFNIIYILDIFLFTILISSFFWQKRKS